MYDTHVYVSICTYAYTFGYQKIHGQVYTHTLEGFAAYVPTPHRCLRNSDGLYIYVYIYISIYAYCIHIYLERESAVENMGESEREKACVLKLILLWLLTKCMHISVYMATQDAELCPRGPDLVMSLNIFLRLIIGLQIPTGFPIFR